jgi:hypothetical protein
MSNWDSVEVNPLSDVIAATRRIVGVTVEQLANEGRRIVCIYRDGTVYKQRRFSEAILRTRLQWNADWNCWSTRDLPKEEEFQQVMCFERCE